MLETHVVILTRSHMYKLKSTFKNFSPRENEAEFRHEHPSIYHIAKDGAKNSMHDGQFKNIPMTKLPILGQSSILYW